jgi:hypothetical protein
LKSEKIYFSKKKFQKYFSMICMSCREIEKCLVGARFVLNFEGWRNVWWVPGIFPILKDGKTLGGR